MSLETWTLESGGVKKTLADWGATDCTYDNRNQTTSFLVLEFAGDAFDSPPRFANMANVLLRNAEDVVVFRGHLIVPDRESQGNSEAVTYHFADPWDYLEQTPFGQRWKNGLVGGYTTTSEVNVPSKIDGNNRLVKISNGEMIVEVINFLNSVMDAPVMQVGTISPAVFKHIDQKTGLSCAQVIVLMLGELPDARCEFDHSTNPPTFHCVQRPQMTAKNITLSSERISSLRLRDRDDFVPTCVGITYRRTDTIDGASGTRFFPDIYPPERENAAGALVPCTGFEYGAINQLIDLEGAVKNHVEGYIETIDIPASPDLQWFLDRGILEGVDATITSFEFLGSTGVLPYEIIDGLIQRWMEDPAGNSAVKFTDTFTAKINYKILGDNGVKEVWDELVTVQIATTNINGNGGVTKRRVASVLSAEEVPVGFAQAVYESLAEPAVEGPLVLTETEAAGDIGLRNTINITGGTNRYANINALPQSITYHIPTGTTTIQLGPPAHLTVEKLLDLQRFNRVRRFWINPDVQETGEVSDEGITLDGAGPSQGVSRAPGIPVMQQWGNSDGQLVRINPSGHQVTAAKSNDTSPMTIEFNLNGSMKTLIVREVDEITKDAAGNCVTKKRLYLCSEQYG